MSIEITQDELDFFQQEHKEKVLRDYNAAIEDNREEAEQKGIKKGIQVGIQEGRQEEKIDNAINFLKLGIAPDIVAKGVDLSVDEVLRLKQNE